MYVHFAVVVDEGRNNNQGRGTLDLGRLTYGRLRLGVQAQVAGL